MRGRGLSEDVTGVKRLCRLHECRKDGNIGLERFEVDIQEFGRDLNQPDLGEEKEGTGEVGGVVRSVEDEDGEEPPKDSHDGVLDMERELGVEGAGDRGEVG